MHIFRAKNKLKHLVEIAQKKNKKKKNKKRKSKFSKNKKIKEKEDKVEKVEKEGKKKKKKKKKKKVFNPYNFEHFFQEEKKPSSKSKKRNKNILDKIDNETQKVDDDFLGNDFNPQALRRIKLNAHKIEYFNTKKESELNKRIISQVLEHQKKYYQSKYSFRWEKNQEAENSIRLLDKWYKVEPVDVAKAIMFLEIPIDKYKLYWLGRLYLSLPMPPNYVEIFDEETDRFVYYDTINHIKLNTRPCYYYVRDLIKHGLKRFYMQNLKRSATLKENFQSLGELGSQAGGMLNAISVNFGSISERMKEKEAKEEKEKQMKFYELNGRVYHVDMEKIIEFFGKKIHIFDPEVQKCRHSHENEFDHALFQMLKKRSHMAKKRFTTQKKNQIFDFDKIEKNPNLKDIAILEVCRQVGIDYEKNPILLGAITNFLLKIEKNNNWGFRLPEFGKCFWINNRLKQAQVEYPHMKKLKEYLKEHLMYQDNVLDRDKKNKRTLASVKWFLKCSDMMGENPSEVLAHHQIPYLEKVMRKKLMKTEEAEEKKNERAKHKKHKISKKKNKSRMGRRNSFSQGKANNLGVDFLKNLKENMEKSINVDRTTNAIYNSRGFLIPVNLKPFVNRCRKYLTKENVLDLLFYCIFDFEVDLNRGERKALGFHRQLKIVDIMHQKFLNKNFDKIGTMLDDEMESILSFRSNQFIDADDDTADLINMYMENAKLNIDFAKQIKEAEDEIGIDFNSLENIEKFMKLGVRFKNRYGDLIMKKKAQLLRQKYLEERNKKMKEKGLKQLLFDEDSIDEEDFRKFIQEYENQMKSQMKDNIQDQLSFLNQLKGEDDKDFGDFTDRFISEYEKKRQKRMKKKQKSKVVGIMRQYFKNELEKAKSRIKARNKLKNDRVRLKIQQGKFVKERNWILDMFNKKNMSHPTGKKKGRNKKRRKDSFESSFGSEYSRKFMSLSKKQKLRSRFGIDFTPKKNIPYRDRLKRKAKRLAFDYPKKKVEKFLKKYQNSKKNKPRKVKKRAKTPDRHKYKFTLNTSMIDGVPLKHIQPKLNKTFEYHSSSSSRNSFMSLFSVETRESIERKDFNILEELSSSFDDSLSAQIPHSIFHSKSPMKKKIHNKNLNKKLSKTINALMSKFRLEKKTVRDKKLKADYEEEEFIHNLVNNNKGKVNSFGKDDDVNYSFDIDDFKEIKTDEEDEGKEETDKLYAKIHKIATVAVMKNLMNKGHKKLNFDLVGKINNSVRKVKEITLKANVVKKLRNGEKMTKEEVVQFKKNKNMIERMLKRKSVEEIKAFIEDNFSIFDQLYMKFLLNLQKKGKLKEKQDEIEEEERLKEEKRFKHFNLNMIQPLPGTKNKSYFQKFGKKKGKRFKNRSFLTSSMFRIGNDKGEKLRRRKNASLSIIKLNLDQIEKEEEVMLKRTLEMPMYFTRKFLDYLISKILYVNQVKFYLKNYGEKFVEDKNIRIEGKSLMPVEKKFKKKKKKFENIDFSRKDVLKANRALITRLRKEMMNKLRKYFYKRSKKIKISKKKFYKSLKDEINEVMSKFSTEGLNRDSSILVFDNQERRTINYSVSDIYDYKIGGLQNPRIHSFNKKRQSKGNIFRISLNPYQVQKGLSATQTYLNRMDKRYTDKHILKEEKQNELVDSVNNKE